MEQIEIIVFNEYRNTSPIERYYSVSTDLWKTSGFSTYVFDRLIPDMNMTYSVDGSWNQIPTPMEMAIDKDDYIAWAQKLCNLHARSNENKF